MVELDQMKLELISADPLKILSSTREVCLEAKFVKINPKGILKIAKLIKLRLGKGVTCEEAAVGGGGKDFRDDVQLTFIRDVVNFCFWAEKDQPKWQVEWPKGEIIAGGAYGLNACFCRAIAEKVPILEAEYLNRMKLPEVKRLFRGANNTEIPLIEKRLENFNEAGRILIKKFNGHFVNVLQMAGNDAIKLVKLICQNFPSFRDQTKYNGQKVVSILWTLNIETNYTKIK